MKAVIFDLDGTLVDSAPGILASFAQAFDDCGRAPNRPLTADLIGPPLRATLAGLCDVADDATLDRLTAAFKAHYDTAGYRETRPFAGIEPMLETLSSAGLALHIATNKRALPTGLIIDHLGWTGRFGRVYALDSSLPPAADKAALLRQLLTDEALDAAEAIYIGDRAEDWQAARANGLPFAWAGWGFGAGVADLDAVVPRLLVPDASALLRCTIGANATPT